MRILVAASAAGIPTMLMFLVYLTGTATVDLTIGGILYLITYLTLAPVVGPLRKSDVGNLKTVFYRISPLATLAKPILRYESWILSATGLDRVTVN
jgi:hypothetical protein